LIGDIISQLGGQSHLEESLSKNLAWITKSFAYNNNLGSCSYKNELGFNSTTYPETTGYLLITLLKAYEHSQNERFLELANNQIKFFSSIQNTDGSFFQKENNRQPIIFDTAQILLGFCRLYQHTPTDVILDIVTKSLNWLNSNLNTEGIFLNYNYKKSYNPSYYTRVFWPMLEASNVLELEHSSDVVNGIERIIKSQNKSLSFPDTSFDGQVKALTHTMAYTVRGLLECSILSSRSDIFSIVEKYMDKMQKIVVRDEKLFGSYNQDWEPDKSFVCVAGNLQFALIALKLDTPKYIQLITTLLSPVIKSQRSFGFNKGAVPSSLPIWGKYQRFRYTNWTQKFYSDALLHLLNKSL